MTTPLIARSDGRAGAGVIVNADERRAIAAVSLPSCPAGTCMQCIKHVNLVHRWSVMPCSCTAIVAFPICVVLGLSSIERLLRQPYLPLK